MSCYSEDEMLELRDRAMTETLSFLPAARTYSLVVTQDIRPEQISQSAETGLRGIVLYADEARQKSATDLAETNDEKAVPYPRQIRPSPPVPDFLLKLMQAESEALLSKKQAEIQAAMDSNQKLPTAETSNITSGGVIAAETERARNGPQKMDAEENEQADPVLLEDPELYSKEPEESLNDSPVDVLPLRLPSAVESDSDPEMLQLSTKTVQVPSSSFPDCLAPIIQNRENIEQSGEEQEFRQEPTRPEQIRMQSLPLVGDTPDSQQSFIQLMLHMPRQASRSILSEITNERLKPRTKTSDFTMKLTENSNQSSSQGSPQHCTSPSPCVSDLVHSSSARTALPVTPTRPPKRKSDANRETAAGISQNEDSGSNESEVLKLTTSMEESDSRPTPIIPLPPESDSEDYESSDRPSIQHRKISRRPETLVQAVPVLETEGWGDEPLKQIDWADTTGAVRIAKRRHGLEDGTAVSSTSWKTRHGNDWCEDQLDMETTNQRIENWMDASIENVRGLGSISAARSVDSTKSTASSAPVDSATVLGRSADEALGIRYARMMERFENGFTYEQQKHHEKLDATRSSEPSAPQMIRQATDRIKVYRTIDTTLLSQSSVERL